MTTDDAVPATIEDAGHVVLSLPTDPRYGSLARMCASALAVQLEFGVDEIEDLRLAVDELSTCCAAGAEDGSRTEIDFAFTDDVLQITCSTSNISSESDGQATPGAHAQETLSERILDALTDAHAFSQPTSDTRNGWIRKHRHGGN